jgi:PBSX family phage terminase large subunit
VPELHPGRRMTAAVVEHRFAPRGAAAKLFECRAGEVLLSGPAGTGKSRACLEKLHMLALLNPGMRALIVRKTLVSLGATALQTWRQLVVPEALAIGEVWFYGGSREEPAQYRYRNGSAIVVGGLDNPTKIMSSEYDVIYVQEAIELVTNDWEALTTRLRHWKITFQQLMADTNPDVPHHWLKQRCDRGDTVMLESRHEDNPLLVDTAGQVVEPEGKAYLDKLNKLTGVRKLRLLGGLWVAAEGLVYDSWDPAHHLVDRFDIPQTWTRWMAVDFGYTNPFVAQWWAEDPDGRLYLYREIYRTKRTVDVHARDILAQVRRPADHVTGREPDPDVSADWVWTEPRPRAVVCDHDAGDRALLERVMGMSTVAATKVVTGGIQATEGRLKVGEDGRPRLMLMRDSLVERDQELAEAMKPCCTAEEVVGYVWDTGGGKKIKEAPLKEDDHGCDAMRYLVAERDLAPRPRIRRL